MYGPVVPVCEKLHADKYRLPNESFEEAMYRITYAMGDDDKHSKQLKNIFLNMRFMPAGRIQSAMGSPRDVTAFNCFVSGVIEDSMQSIMAKATEAAETMRRILSGLWGIVLFLLILLPAVLYHLCISMMRFVARYFRLVTDAER